MKRREFLSTTALAAVCAGCGSFNVGAARGRRPAPSETLNLAVIGCGTMGMGNMNGFLRDKRVRVVVTCDPVKDSPAYGYDKDWKKKWRGGRVPFAEKVDDFYKQKGCRAVADWREVVADPTVDAVLIATTDHWHALIAVAAMKAGKHVYCQKPLSMSIAEGRLMSDVASKTGVVFQVGSQQRSAKEFREAAELVRNGYLGDCTTCTIGLSYAHNDSHRNGFGRDGKPRAALPDYWKLLGEQRVHPRHPRADGVALERPHRQRRPARLGRAPPRHPPMGARHGAGRSRRDRELHERHGRRDRRRVQLAGFRATVSDSDACKFCGLKFHAPKGDLFVTRGKIEKPVHLANWKESDLKDTEVHLHKSRGSHESDFVDAIFDPSWQPACTCETGHRSITISHLANSCAKTGVKSLKWDAAKEVSDNAAINARADIVRHNGWSLKG